MEILRYSNSYSQQAAALILQIQNAEAGIGLSLEEQPDLSDIERYYFASGGYFWLALNGEQLIGTIALMNMGEGNGVMKKFFVRKDFRHKGVGYELYRTLLKYAEENGFRRIVLDTPSVAVDSHRFYEKAGFSRIKQEELPFEYHYPDRNSLLYILKL